MRHKMSGRKFNRTKSHRKALFVNLANALIQHEQIKTTLPKAKDLRPIVEKYVTMAKTAKDILSTRRLLSSRLRDAQVVEKLLTTLAPRYAERPGGYIRIIKAGFRHGDMAPMGIIEFVDRPQTSSVIEGSGALQPLEVPEA